MLRELRPGKRLRCRTVRACVLSVACWHPPSASDRYFELAADYGSRPIQSRRTPGPSVLSDNQISGPSGASAGTRLRGKIMIGMLLSNRQAATLILSWSRDCNFASPAQGSPTRRVNSLFPRAPAVAEGSGTTRSRSRLPDDLR